MNTFDKLLAIASMLVIIAIVIVVIALILDWKKYF